MNKSLRIFSSMILLILLIFSVPIAKVDAFSTFDEMKRQADAFEQKGQQAKIIDDNTIAEIVAPIGTFLVGVGTIVVVVVTILLGLKYMSAPDPNTQAQVKKQIIGVVVSAIVIFGAYGIWAFVYNFMDDII